MIPNPLFIPVILGTVRQGRQSEKVANFMLKQLSQREDIVTELIDIRELPITTQDAGLQAKDDDFAGAIARCEGKRDCCPRIQPQLSRNVEARSGWRQLYGMDGRNFPLNDSTPTFTNLTKQSDTSELLLRETLVTDH